MKNYNFLLTNKIIIIKMENWEATIALAKLPKAQIH